MTNMAVRCDVCLWAKENILSTCFAFGELKPNINWNTMTYMFGLQCAGNWNLAQRRTVFLFREITHIEINTSERIWTFCSVTYKVSLVTQWWHLLCTVILFNLFFNLGTPSGKKHVFYIYLFCKIFLLYFPSATLLTIMWNINPFLSNVKS